jgi:ABC-type transport system involved in multi-copper enzyme maturation permease subunit
VFWFELRRTLTLSRFGVWLLLVLFPVFITTVVKYYEDQFKTVGLGRPPQRSIYSRSEARTGKPQHRDGQRSATIKLKMGSEVRELGSIAISHEFSPETMGPLSAELFEQHLLGTQGPPEQAELSPGIDDTIWGFIFFGLLPQGVTLLGLLLWATPLVQAELEGKTWIYLAVRPRGRASVLFGKYLAAITWTAVMGWTSATLCVLVAQPEYAWRLWGTLILVVGFACLGYGALYSLIGVLEPRRAMVLAVGYTLVFEFLVSLVPAVINQFTVQYRLRNLFVLFMGWRRLIPEDAGRLLLGDQPAWLHILILCGYALGLMLVARQVIRRREYVSAEEV